MEITGSATAEVFTYQNSWNANVNYNSDRRTNDVFSRPSFDEDKLSVYRVAQKARSRR